VERLRFFSSCLTNLTRSTQCISSHSTGTRLCSAASSKSPVKLDLPVQVKPPKSALMRLSKSIAKLPIQLSASRYLRKTSSCYRCRSAFRSKWPLRIRQTRKSGTSSSREVKCSIETVSHKSRTVSLGSRTKLGTILLSSISCPNHSKALLRQSESARTGCVGINTIILRREHFQANGRPSAKSASNQ
jgi:hypothetical protein